MTTYAVVLGRHDAVWEELERAKEMIRPRPYQVIAVKRAGRDYDGMVHHWASFHPNLFDPWVRERAAAGRPPAGKLWAGKSPKVMRQPTYALPMEWLTVNGGSSGLLGVMVGLKLGIDKILLCGVPMEQTGRYDDEKMWKEALIYRKAWEEYLPQLQGRVKSFSGWTRELLGEPTDEWLNDLEVDSRPATPPGAVASAD